MCTCRVATSMTNSTGQQPFRLNAQERSPGCVRVPRCGSASPGARDPPYCRLADPVTEAGQLALHPAIS
jgi:hypothetical protein